MLPRPVRATVALVIALLAASPLTAAPATAAAPTARPSIDAATLDAALADITSAGAPAAFAEVVAGRQTWRGADGAARPWYFHRIGSVTKTFTATTVLHLVAEGRIRLDAPIGRYLRRLPLGGYADTVTVRMLLNQTSGIGDYDSVLFGTVEGIEQTRTTTYRPRELARIGLTQPATNPPGARSSYSNTNYVLAGLIIESVTGRSAPDEIRRRIIRPLGMWRTYFPGRFPHIVGPHARGYVPWTDGLRDFTTYNMSWAWTAGEIVSTTHDVNRFFDALLNGRILPATLMAEMRRTVPLNAEAPAAGGYGLGLIRIPLPCGEAWGHDGVVWGYSTMSFHRDGGRGTTLAINLSHYQTDPATPHPLDVAQGNFLAKALCGASAAVVEAGADDRRRPVPQRVPA
jgi:D-alanyl-D-alanine carboxypeptidase